MGNTFTLTQTSRAARLCVAAAALLTAFSAQAQFGGPAQDVYLGGGLPRSGDRGICEAHEQQRGIARGVRWLVYDHP